MAEPTKTIDKSENKDIKKETEVKRSFPYVESRKVFIRRKPLVSAFRQTNAASFESTLCKIGGSSRHNDVLRGLTPEEEVRFLPKIIGTQPTNDKWEEACRAYWNNISRNVDEKGIELEVGLIWATEDAYNSKFQFNSNDKALIKDENGVLINSKGTPINIADYILWRYCLVYSECANDAADIHKSNKIRMYIFSQEIENKVKKNKFALEKEANQLFYGSLSDTNWTKWLLRLLVTKDPNPEKKVTIGQLMYMAEDDINIALAEYIKKDPQLFLTLGKDKSLELKSFIEECIAVGRLVRIANTEAIAFENDTIGNTLDQAVAFLSSPANSNTLNTLRAQINVNK